MNKLKNSPAAIALFCFLAVVALYQLLPSHSASAQIQGTLPDTIELSEHTDRYGTFTVTLRKVGDHYEGTYNNGVKTVVTITRYDRDVVEMSRRDLSGPSMGGASYAGRRTGNRVTGEAYFPTGSGTFQAVMTGGRDTTPPHPTPMPSPERACEDSPDCPHLSARLICKDPLVLHRTSKNSVSEEHCIVCIKGWRRNTADPVQVVFPEQGNWWGLHANGIKVFAGGNDNPLVIGPMSLDPSRMSGYRCPDSDSFRAGEYPWGFFIKADPEALPGRSFAIPIIVRQKGASEAKVVLDGSVAGGGNNPIRTFAIQTSNGHFLTAVSGGGIKGPGAIHTDATQISGWEQFVLVSSGGNKYAIQTSKGTYLTAVRGGGIGGADAIHTDTTQVSGWEQFTLIALGGELYAIQTFNGHYLTAVGGGGSQRADAIHTDATKIGAWEQFTLRTLESRAKTNRSAGNLPTRWKSLTTGTTKVLRYEGNYIRWENQLTEEERKLGVFYLGEVQKQGDKYVGALRIRAVYAEIYQKTGERVVTRVCSIEQRIEFTLVTSSRIEGRVFGPPLGAKLDFEKCEYSEPDAWLTFVWIPE
jgi:hypothetical protein